ncbi:MAG: thioredoxin family protein [Anaerolineales bacterium]|jgi:hypothetical protein
MKIEILGTGCRNCLELELLVGKIVSELGLRDVEVSRVDDERQIRRYIPLDAIPGLVIDGNLVSERQVPGRETLKRWLVAT